MTSQRAVPKLSVFADRRFKRRQGYLGLPSSAGTGEAVEVDEAEDFLRVDVLEEPPAAQTVYDDPAETAYVEPINVCRPGHAVRQEIERRLANAAGVGAFSLANGTVEPPSASAGEEEKENESDDSTAEQPRKKKKRRKIGRPQDALAGASRRKTGRLVKDSRNTKTGHNASRPITANYLNRKLINPAEQKPDTIDDHEAPSFVVCSGHKARADLRVAKKNENKGRRFYTCANKAQKCDFFEWADELARRQLSSHAAALRGIENGRPFDVSDAIGEEQEEEADTRRELPLRSTLKLIFGYDTFRPGQRESIESILRGDSCLTILPTGGGKSLCYILSAYLLPGSVLVISPLLALMKDQLERLPNMTPGACIHSGVQLSVQKAIMADFALGKIKILFVAPERLQDRGFLAHVSVPGRISMVCVDEAHCIAEWSHNFRPVYSKLHRILSQTIRPRRVLALTATATLATRRSICEGLGIPTDSIVTGELSRPNLTISVSAEKNKRTALRALLRQEGFNQGAVVVYVSRQSDADTIAHELRSVGLSAAAYHARHTHSVRESTQNKFIAGDVRVLVATVAFGMGVDKRNIRGVIHYSLPRSLEAYYQEIGRAGRDGLPSSCHLFCNEEDIIYNRSQAYTNCVEEQTLLKLMRHLFLGQLPCADIAVQKGCQPTKVTSIDPDTMELKLDLHREVLETALVQLESLIRVQGDAEGQNCEKVQSFELFKGAPTRLRIHFDEAKMAKEGSSFLNNIIVNAKQRGNTAEVTLLQLAKTLNKNPSQIMEEVENAREWGYLSFECLGMDQFLVVWSGTCDLSLCANLASALYKRLGDLQGNVLYKSERIARVMKEALMTHKTEQTQYLNDEIRQYFSTEHLRHNLSHGVLNPLHVDFNERLLESDIAKLVEGREWGPRLRTPMQVTRVLHGHSSPNFQAQDWFQCSHWRRYAFLDFDALKGLVTSVMAKIRA